MKLRNGKTIGNEPIIGYKMASWDKLVILEIPPTALHNMNRTNIADRRFAKYRCSEAFVKEIVDLKTGINVMEAFSKQVGSFNYVVGQRVFPEFFDRNLEKVCTGGIHYFIDRPRAEMYERKPFNGVHKEWYDDGLLSSECVYRNGRVEGVLKVWHKNGQLALTRFYKNGLLQGESKLWYENGKLHRVENFKDGMFHGVSKEWDEDGNLTEECLYDDGYLSKNWYRD